MGGIVPPVVVNVVTAILSILTTTGDMLYRGGAGLSRLAIGSSNHVLTVAGGLPTWAAGSKATLTATGDLLYASAANALARLAIGTTNYTLGVVAGVPAWIPSPTSVLTTTGDILYASAANTLARLAAGANGTILTVAAGIPAWATAANVVGAYILTILTSSGGFLYRTSGGALGQSLQGTSALGAYAIDWAAADRFTKTLAGGDTFTHSNTEAKIAIRLVLTVNGQAVPSGIGTAAPGTATWSSAWTTAWVIIMKDGAGGYEYTLTGA